MSNQYDPVQEMHQEFNKVFTRQVTLMQGAERVIAGLKWQGGASQQNAIALESLVPGIITEKLPINSFTERYSRTNFEFAMESAENIIVRGVKAIIEAFLQFVKRAAGWVTAHFTKTKDATDPDEVAKTVQVRTRVQDFYRYMDVYPEIVEKFMTQQKVEPSKYPHQRGGKLLESFMQDALEEALEHNDNSYIRALIDDGFVVVKANQLQTFIMAFNVYLNNLQAKIKEYNLDVPMNQNQADAIDKSLNQMWMSHLHIQPENIQKLLEMFKSVPFDTKDPKGDAKHIVENVGKFFNFYNNRACLEMKKYSMADIQKQCDALGHKAQTNHSLAPAITSVQHQLRIALMGMTMVDQMTKLCASFNNRYLKGVIKTYKLQLDILEMVEKSPRAVPADVAGMKHSKEALKAEIARLEKL